MTAYVTHASVPRVIHGRVSQVSEFLRGRLWGGVEAEAAMGALPYPAQVPVSAQAWNLWGSKSTQDSAM